MYKMTLIYVFWGWGFGARISCTGMSHDTSLILDAIIKHVTKLSKPTKVRGTMKGSRRQDIFVLKNVTPTQAPEQVGSYIQHVHTELPTNPLFNYLYLGTPVWC